MTSNNELAQRYQTTVDVFTKFQQMKTLADGSALSYPKSPEWNTRLQRFAEVWRKSCPYFTFEIVSESDNGSVWLHITGPEGTSSFVEGAHQMLTSSLNPAPSKRLWLKWKFVRITNAVRILPDFLIIGAKKCGTTSLYAYLTQHPHVASAFRKEIYYFDGYYRHGSSWYRAFFPTRMQRFYQKKIKKANLISGEASPEYILDPNTPARVFETIPAVKLIAILRNPVDKAYSYYQHQLRVGFETLTFEEAIDREIENLKKDPGYFDQNHSYLAGCQYAEQLERWLKVFPKEQLLVIGNEELSTAPEKTFAKVLEFLNLPTFSPKTFKRLNAFPYPDMSGETRERLVKYFKPYNEKLYALLDRKLEWDN